jgi:hypothetical protein
MHHASDCARLLGERAGNVITALHRRSTIDAEATRASNMSSNAN